MLSFYLNCQGGGELSILESMTVVAILGSSQERGSYPRFVALPCVLIQFREKKFAVYPWKVSSAFNPSP